MLGEGGSSYDDDEFEDSVESSSQPVADRADDPDEGAPRGRGRTRNRNRGRNRGRGRGQGGRGGDEDRQPEGVEAASGESPVQSEPSDEGEPREERRGRSGGRRGRGSGRGGSRSNDRSDRDDRSPRSDARDSSDDRPDRNQNRRNEDSQPIIREKDEEAEQLVSDLIDYFLGAMGVVAETYIREDEEDGSMTFEIEGQDAGLLIGRRGETLQALQFLIRMVTNRQLGRKAYVVIDIEDYRERRVQMLRRLARRTAGRVGSSGREDSLEPMSPAERRIVHMALAGHPEVRTESEGEGNQRRVVIFPL